MDSGTDGSGATGAGTSWTLPTPPDFRLAPTVLSHGIDPAPPFHWAPDEGVLTRILRDSGGKPWRVEVREEPIERVEIVHGGGGGARPEEIRTLALGVRTPGGNPDEDEMVEVEEALVFMLGLARDLHGFHELCRDEPRLSRIPEIGAGRLLKAPSLWEELARAVCGADVPPERAAEATAALNRLGEPVDGLHAWPEPRAVLDAGDAALRAEDALGQRAGPILELARRIVEGKLDPGPAEAGLLDADALGALFRSVPGIGEAHAERLLILYGHTDRLPMDRGVVTFVRDLHFGGRTPTEAEVRAHYERYGEWKGLVYWFEVVQELLWPRMGVSF